MAKRYEQKKKAAQIVRQQQEREERRRQLVLGASILGVIVLLGGIIAGGIWLSQGTEYEVVEPKAAHTETGAVVIGEGPVTVDLYIDYMCPACKQFEEGIAGQLNAYVQDSAVTVNYHPLGFLDGYSLGTEYSSRAASASVCAADDGRFVEYTTALFNNQPAENTTGLPDDELIEIGREVGLGDSFQTCVENNTYRGWINEGTAHALDVAKVTATPTVLIDGSKVDSSTFLDTLAAAIADAGITGDEEVPADEESPAGDEPSDEATKDEEGTEPEDTTSPSSED